MTGSKQKGQKGTTKRTLLCIDGSEHSLRAFNWYFERLHHQDDEVCIVHIHVPPELPSLGLIHGAIELYTKEIEKSMEQSKATLKKFKMLCNEKGVVSHAYLEILDDSIGYTLCKVAKQKHVSLIVIGQRGLGAVRRTLFGSVSDYILHHTHIPTVVIPPPE